MTAMWLKDLPSRAFAKLRSRGLNAVRRLPSPLKGWLKSRLAFRSGGTRTDLARGTQFLVPLQAAGSSYSEEQLATKLQYENAYLKRAFFREAGTYPVVPAGAAEPTGSSADELVAAYLDAGEASGIPHAQHLVIVGAYPRSTDEYGGGFIHRRIKHYLASGVRVHVAAISPTHEPEIYEYDGVRVLAGRGAELGPLLAATSYRSISTHFLNNFMWAAMAPHLHGQRLYCFVHGFEARSWIRTLHNVRDMQALDAEIGQTLQRQKLWRDVAAHPWGPRKFVYVSAWWRKASQQDMELHLPANRTQIIHNVIDTDLFRYEVKDPSQRFRLLWVRPATNWNYASDIAVAVLSRLRETEHWQNLHVRIVGDGRHFGAFEKQFSQDANVTIERHFVPQEQIAQLHREHGLFLVPTRLDTQGVSRDEAMASGLVPITNRVAAVPEFVDSDCAVLAGPEDVDAMVSGIISILSDPDRFMRMSEAAARRAAAQSGPEATVLQELEMMQLTDMTKRGG